jgi:hypothetical protein
VPGADDWAPNWRDIPNGILEQDERQREADAWATKQRTAIADEWAAGTHAELSRAYPEYGQLVAQAGFPLGGQGLADATIPVPPSAQSLAAQTRAPMGGWNDTESSGRTVGDASRRVTPEAQSLSARANDANAGLRGEDVQWSGVLRPDTPVRAVPTDAPAGDAPGGGYDPSSIRATTTPPTTFSPATVDRSQPAPTAPTAPLPSPGYTSSVRAPVSGTPQTTVALSGGQSDTQLGPEHQRSLDTLGAWARFAGLGELGAQVAQAVGLTEGALVKRPDGLDRGDGGRSYSLLQLYRGGGQLANFAADMGMTEEQAGEYARDNPSVVSAWALNPRGFNGWQHGGYLNAAIQRGQEQGLTGADLATYVQKTGQVSVSPERAGANFERLFGNGGSGLVPDATRPAPRDISQFGDPELSADEAYAACGPAAAVRFAQRFGRNPTLREATDLAAQVGWTKQQGMAGIGSEQALLTKMGIPTKLVRGAQWSAFVDEVNTGNPVILSTAGHYWSIDGYDPERRAFHVGKSGLDVAGGAEWMTPDEITSRLGSVQGALFADNPTVATSSTAPEPRNPLDWLGQQKDRAVSSLDSAVQAVASVVNPQQPASPGMAAPGQGYDPSHMASSLAPDTDVRLRRDVRDLGPSPDTASPPGVDFARQVQSPNTGNPVIDLHGTAYSALGTLTHDTVWPWLRDTVGPRVRDLSPPSGAARTIAGTDQQSADLASKGYPQMLAELNGLIDRQAAGEQGLEPRMQELSDRMNALTDGMSTNEAMLAAAERNPKLPALETTANLAAGALAIPLSAEGVPLVARVIAEVLQPGQNTTQVIKGANELLNNPAAREILGPTARVLEDAVAQSPRSGVAPVVEAVRRFATDESGELRLGGGREVAPPRAAETAAGEASSVLDHIVPKGAKPTKVEQALDSGLILPGADEGAGLAQILGPRGEVLSTIARAERSVPSGTRSPIPTRGDVTGVVRSEAGAAAIGEPSKATVARMPNLARMAPDMPDVQASLQRVAEENPALIDTYRQGVITHQELIEDLAPRLGMTADDFVKSPVGKAFNPEELLTLRAAVVEKQANAVRLAQEIADKGGVDALSAAEKVDAIGQIVDAARLQAVGRGGASTAGRALNQQKIVINEEMARAITGGNETKAAQQAASAADARIKRAADLLEKNKTLAAEKQAAVDAAQRIATEQRQRGLGAQISKAYDELAAYQAMTLEEKGVDLTKRTAERAALAAKRAAALKTPDAPQALLSALQDELAAERKIFSGSKNTWETMAFWASKRGDKLKEKGALEGPAFWLEAQRKAAADEARIANQRAERAFDLTLRVRERQQQQAGKLLEALGGKKVTDDVLRHFVELQQSGDPLATAKFLQGMANVSVWDRIILLRYASMLSSTATHLTNSMGNAIQLGLDVALKPVAVGVDAATSRITGAERTRYMGEIGPQVRGMADGTLAGFKDGWTTLKTGIDPRYAGKLDQVRPGFGSGSEKLNFAAEAPLRLLAAADNVFRGAARGGQVRALATRQGIREGYAGTALAKRAEWITQNITEFPQLLEEAEKSAARTVLQESRVEIAGLSARRGAGPAAFVQSVFLPFVKTPYNIAAQGLGMTPAGLLSAAKAAKDGNRGEAADRAARALFGSAVMGVAGAAGMSGFLTGAYPTDDSARSTLPPGWKPWSVRLPRQDGAMYVSYQNLGPVGVPMAIAAVMTEAARQGQPIDPAKVVAGFGRYMVDQTFLQGINSVVQAIEQPERYAENLSEGLAAPTVPYSALQRQIERAIGMADRDPHGAVDALLATSPLTANAVAPRTTPLGQPVQQGQAGAAAFISPVRYDFEHDTPALQALRGADVGVPAMPKKLTVQGGEIQLTPSEQAQLKALRGQRIDELIAEEVRTSQFQNLNAVGQQKRLRQLVEHATSQVDKAFVNTMADDEFDRRRRQRAAPVPYQVGP